MKFLLVATFAWPDHFGGAERVIGEVAARLVRRGHAVTLLTSRLEGLPPAETRDGVEVRRYAVDRGSPPAFYRSVFAGVRRALEDPAAAGADLLHVHQPLSGVAAVAPGARRPRPVLHSFYAPYHQEYLARHREGQDTGRAPAAALAVSALLRHADRYLLRRSDRILVLSEFTRGQVAELLPSALPRTVLAPAGVDLERFHPPRDAAERARADELLDLPEGDAPLVVSVRRLEARMGLADLIEACRLLRTRGVALRLVIAGDGPLRGELRAQIERAGLPGCARLLGRVSEAELPDLYRAASVFALPTRSLEGFGLATAEALASGLPVVASSAGATPELLADVPGTVLCPPGDPPALARALAPLLADAAGREAAGRAARAHAERSLGWERHLAAVEEAARSVVSAR